MQVVGQRDAAHDLTVPGGIGSSVLQGETIMVKLRFALAGSLLLSGVLLAAVTQAEESFSASGTTCRDITWKPEVLAKYPNVAAACQGVVQQGGETYAKFVGTVVQNSPSGLRMRFKGSHAELF